MIRELLIEKFNPDYTDNKGDSFWTNRYGYFHRDGDNPAIVGYDGRMEWWKNGTLHRDGDKPAVINSVGMFWCKEGLAHRDNDKPAVICYNGIKEWFKNGRTYNI